MKKEILLQVWLREENKWKTVRSYPYPCLKRICERYDRGYSIESKWRLILSDGTVIRSQKEESIEIEGEEHLYLKKFRFDLV